MSWRERAKEHTARVGPLADAFLKRRMAGETHAVHDFLFTYYCCSPQKLKQWVPSFEESLIVTPEILAEYPWLSGYWFHQEGDILALNRAKLNDNIRSLAAFIAKLCDNIRQRAPRFGCYGLHEWAMVYKTQELRHKQPLRVSPADLAAFVESQTLCCTHYDAYRFFTKEAHPLNILNPTLDTRLEMEQGGCIHANMDLYKWASKLWPWVGSDLLAKTFLLAVRGRELDMRASPYDLPGFPPIPIETESGRREYQREQQLYAHQSAPLRQELGEFCRRLLA